MLSVRTAQVRTAAVGWTASTDASDTVTPLRRNENTTNGEGVGSVPGSTRTHPLRMTSDGLEFLMTKELRGGIVYDVELTSPPLGSNSTFPRIVWLVGLTNIV